MTIHWCGTGLSAIPGLRRLIENGREVTVWNRTVEKAQEAVGDLTDDIRAFSLEALADALKPGDIAVSMLPGDLHVPVAKLCLENKAHFVSSSYIAPEMKALDGDFKEAGLACVNEIGLDPGIDHLMAHWLVADYRASDAYDAANKLSFISYCGGVPKISNPFRYKFSWSPLGVLKALRSPSKSIKDGAPFDVARPWDAISSYDAPLQQAESFEVYPNRDSLPFMEDYKFDPAWDVDTFVRGTLRLNGWADAWKDVFAEVETLEGEAGDARLKEMSDQFWDENSYDDGEPDRVIMCVALKAEKGGAPAYHKTYVMDAWGDDRGTAMARLVSTPVSLAIDMVLDGKAPAGVTAATADPEMIETWMGHVNELAQHVAVVDHTA
ncbi:saccharopine dehydrogenase NADP-binding domain-containing protein [Aliiroseovarius sp. S1123]|jgi:saccharopine dehydrogenase (NADP+, L-glutamate forming)|uniref:saccharopine dehydrogenase family protein n=1 Tax=unclassified Aliiroseovarius TaxID=2623558 RepID=UPI001FF67956|nr:saccharopine dehydrogenase family protein [Aliiroseovarius sp. S1123]MCK0170793.1 saccharopine dehydrogenase NADP-binding domain-containing protein [Aliiroseovarius sp. S1123]